MATLSKALIFIKANLAVVLVSTVSAAAITGGCIYLIFKDTPDISKNLLISDCRDIPDLDEKYRCYADNALSTSDISWCKKIPANYCGDGSERNLGRAPNGNRWQACIELVAVDIKKRELCDLIPTKAHGCDPDYPTIPWRDVCNYKLAIFFHDRQICGKIFDKKEAQLCHEELIARTKHPQNFPKPY